MRLLHMQMQVHVHYTLHVCIQWLSLVLLVTSLTSH